MAGGAPRLSGGETIPSERVGAWVLAPVRRRRAPASVEIPGRPGYTRRMSRLRGLLAAAALVAAAPAAGEWKVDAQGACVREWTPRDLLRGPTAMLDAPLVPIRFIEGAVVDAADCSPEACGPTARTLLGTSGVLLGAGFGTLWAFVDLVLGFLETFSGGAVELSEPDPTRLSLRPIHFVLPGDVCCVFMRPQPLGRDRCGRTIYELPAPQPWQPPWWRRVCPGRT